MDRLPIDDAAVVGSDGWWLKRLLGELNAVPTRVDQKLCNSRRGMTGRRDWMDILWAYNTNNPPLTHMDRQRQDYVKQFLRFANHGYAGLTVKAMTDRINLTGLRTVADRDADGDDTFRKIMGDNGAWLSDTLAYVFALSEGYAMVGRDEATGRAVITAEDPRQCVSIDDPLNPMRPRAALKCWRDEFEHVDYAHVFLPAGESGSKDRVRVAVRRSPNAVGSRFVASSWQWDDSRSGDLPVQGFGTPLVPLRNELGLGEFEQHLDLLDRITSMIGDRLWLSKIQAFRQRALVKKNGAPPIDVIDARTGKKTDVNRVFEAEPDALWELPEGYEIWESTPLDIQGLLLAVRDDVKEFSAVTRTPLIMFTPDSANQTATGSELTEKGLTSKARDRVLRLTPAVAKIGRMSLAYDSRYKGDVPDEVEPIWGPITEYTITEKASAAASAAQAGLPWESVMTDIMQMTPAQMTRVVQQRTDDALAAALRGGQGGNG